MQPSYISVMNVFTQQTRYTVPLFQRPYVWKKEDQWQPLWDDVREAAERVLNAQGKLVSSHFLGTVVLDQTLNPIQTVSASTHSPHLDNVTHNPGRKYEGTTNNPRTTVFCPKDKNGVHPFQKPLALLEYLIRTYSNEGDVVFDSFMGSGSTCVAALRSGRRSIGIEMTEEYFLVAQERAAAMIEQVTSDVTPKSMAA